MILEPVKTTLAPDTLKVKAVHLFVILNISWRSFWPNGLSPVRSNLSTVVTFIDHREPIATGLIDEMACAKVTGSTNKNDEKHIAGYYLNGILETMTAIYNNKV